jgi:hypothetical protein
MQTTTTAAPLVIGVTSHRNLLPGEVDPIRRLVRALFARLRGDFPHTPLIVLTSLAEGGDQLVAEEALAANVRVIAALPMLREQYEHDFADTAALARFAALCDAAEVVVVPHADGSRRNMDTQAPDGEARDRHYAQAGVYVSDHCHLLLAIWDGKSLSLLGGTAQIAHYHLSGVKPAPGERRRGERRNLLGYGSERLVYHIACSRDQPDGSPAPPLGALQTQWRSGDRALPGEGPLPDTFQSAFARADEFNVDAGQHAAPIDASNVSAADASAPPAAHAIDRMFHTADWLAMHFQRRVVLAMRVLYTLAALMAIAFTLYDNLPAQDNMLYVFLLLFALGGFIVVLANRRGWHRKYLDYRALAEGLRVQSYWRRAGISLTGDAEFARDNFLQKQDVELGWVRNVMRGVGLESAIGTQPTTADELRAVVREWVGDGKRGGQLEYYGRKAVQHARTYRITEAIGSASLCVGIAISVALALFAGRLSGDAKNALVMTMAVFSIVAGVRSAYAYKKADKELIKQYRYMHHIFDEARIALDDAVDADEQRETLRVLGEAALAEQVEWALMHRQRPLEHNRI